MCKDTEQQSLGLKDESGQARCLAVSIVSCVYRCQRL